MHELRITYWSAENLILIDCVLLHEVKFAVKAAMVIGTIFLPETVCAHKYITLHSFSVFVYEVVKQHANTLASKTLPASSVHNSRS